MSDKLTPASSIPCKKLAIKSKNLLFLAQRKPPVAACSLLIRLYYKRLVVCLRELFASLSHTSVLCKLTRSVSVRAHLIFANQQMIIERRSGKKKERYDDWGTFKEAFSV